MTQHTQGPWLLTDKDMHGRYQIKDYKQKWIAVTDDGNLANARLIASAPELLEALERIVEYHVPKINPLLDASILSAQSTINKAKGE